MTRKNGFTLLELSIVLTIIGFIIGATMVGQSLVRAAQLRDAISEYDTYVKAIKEFQDKYLALPGDMNNATTIWSGTANGDGSGTIGTSDAMGNAADTAGSAGTTGEWFLAWQHLSLAGFVSGSFTGQYGPGGANEAVIGSNVPASKASGAGWTLLYYLNTSGNAGLWSDQYGHILAFGGYISGDYTKGAILTPAEAFGIDQKLDDGLPGTGKVRAWRTNTAWNGNCTTNDTLQNAEVYNTIPGLQCSLVFLLGF